MPTAEHLTHKGWTISQNEWTGQWEAVGPDYDASTDGPEGDWVDNGERVFAASRKALIEEIDAFLLERETPDMTAREAARALRALREEIGPKADANLGISDRIFASLYPNGLCERPRLFFPNARTLRGAVAGLKAQWAEHQALHADNTIKAMALAIIRLTFEVGECTDAALRCEFSQTDIDRHGEAATARASEMGGNSPFKIVRLGVGDNPVEV